jgi:hypothetical protein
MLFLPAAISVMRQAQRVTKVLSNATGGVTAM